jgi:hypothetical protein
MSISSIPPSEFKAQISNKLTDDGIVPGTKEQLEKFWEKYKDYDQQSDKCYLDGRYFFKTLFPFDGLCFDEFYMQVHHGVPVEVDTGCKGRTLDVNISFDPEMLQLAEGPLRLVKMIIAGTTETNENKGTLHCNLLYFDYNRKEIVRFEPILDEQYTPYINKKLKEYFNEEMPDFTFRMMNCHPQLMRSDRCPSRGMCMAYVLKLAMILATNTDDDFIVHEVCPFVYDYNEEEERILRFASAIEKEQGSLPGKPEMVFGWYDDFLESKYHPKNIYAKFKESKYHPKQIYRRYKPQEAKDIKGPADGKKGLFVNKEEVYALGKVQGKGISQGGELAGGLFLAKGGAKLGGFAQPSPVKQITPPPMPASMKTAALSMTAPNYTAPLPPARVKM